MNRYRLNRTKLFSCLLFFGSLTQTILAAPLHNSLLSIQLESRAASSDLLLETQQLSSFRHFGLGHPPRVVLDFPNTQWRVHRIPPLQGSSFKWLRYAHRADGTLRVVLELQHPGAVMIKRRTTPGAAGTYLVLLHTGNAPIHWPAIKSSPRSTFVPSSPAALPLKASPEVIPEPAIFEVLKTPVGTLQGPAPLAHLRKISVVIDAGHGGHDPGTIGAGPVFEKAVVLSIAKKLQNNLNAQPGFQAFLTRKGDYYIPLRTRLDLGRRDHADLFISIHADASLKKYSSGASVYALSERGATSEAAKWLAERENRSELMGGVSLPDKDQMLRSVLIDLSQTATINTSIEAGREMLNQLHGITPLHSGRVERAAFVVLKSPDIPSLLIETGFLSNPTEAKRLRSTEYQQGMANAIARGIVNYFEKVQMETR